MEFFLRDTSPYHLVCADFEQEWVFPHIELGLVEQKVSISLGPSGRYASHNLVVDHVGIPRVRMGLYSKESLIWKCSRQWWLFGHGLMEKVREMVSHYIVGPLLVMNLQIEFLKK